MKIAMDKLCIVFSRAFDVIEEEQIGASERHSMRVAALCAKMGKKLGFDADALSGIATCGMFHDNALTEYHLSMQNDSSGERNMLLHCEKGQENVSWLPFRTKIDGFILFHHECGIGTGPFRRRDGEFPFEAALIAAADACDVDNRFQAVPPKDLPALRSKIDRLADTYSTRKAIDVLLEILDEEVLESLRDENISRTLDNDLPRWEADITEPGVIRAAGFLARVIDYKSQFTQKHTSQIANRAWLMAESYGYNEENKASLFLAASLHDIGKIKTPIEILEKQGKLDDREFKIIKNHVAYTRSMLNEVPDFELITNRAANHHEKLDGSGYALGTNAEDLDFDSRLIACLDIYQAVSEPRPYHDARSHEETISILRDMAEKGFIDADIVKDVDSVMAEYSMQNVPSPLDEKV
ncbi:MAG: HD domain-containing protein [Oscillospiraceae bacterium]|nr:HD domain-containing protein [Oscillospiraceae bacterium]